MAGVPASSFWERRFRGRDRSDEECVELPVQELLDLLGYPEHTEEYGDMGLFKNWWKPEETLVDKVEEERDLKIQRH